MTLVYASIASLSAISWQLLRFNSLKKHFPQVQRFKRFENDLEKSSLIWNFFPLILAKTCFSLISPTGKSLQSEILLLNFSPPHYDIFQHIFDFFWERELGRGGSTQSVKKKKIKKTYTASPVQHCKQFTKWEHRGTLFSFVIVYYSLAFCPGIRNCGAYTSELRTVVFVDVGLNRWFITCSILSEWITLTRPQFHVRNALVFLCALWVWRSGIIFKFHFWSY